MLSIDVPLTQAHFYTIPECCLVNKSVFLIPGRSFAITTLLEAVEHSSLPLADTSRQYLL